MKSRIALVLLAISGLSLAKASTEAPGDVVRVESLSHGFGSAEVMIRSFNLIVRENNYLTSFPDSHQVNIKLYSISQISSLRELVDENTRLPEVIKDRGYDYQPFVLIRFNDAPIATYTFNGCILVDEKNGAAYPASEQLIQWAAAASLQQPGVLVESSAPCNISEKPMEGRSRTKGGGGGKGRQGHPLLFPRV